VHHDGFYIECQNQKHFWHDNPLYIFDDTLFHRSVNEYMTHGGHTAGSSDIMRPTRFPDYCRA
jgi:beta-hydroxylase